MDPVTMSAVAIGTSVAGGITGGIGSMFSGEANAAAYTYKAGVALINKQINLQNAAWATESGGISAEESGLKSGQQIAQTKAIQGASGFDVNTGSAEAVRDTQTKVAQFDQNVIRWDAAKTAYGYETKAAMDDAEASMDMAAASNAKTSGILGAITSFVNAGSSVASKWAQGSALGIFGNNDAGVSGGKMGA